MVKYNPSSTIQEEFTERVRQEHRSAVIMKTAPIFVLMGLTEWDEEMIRQLVHTVKVISADHIRVYLNDGTEIDQTVSP